VTEIDGGSCYCIGNISTYSGTNCSNGGSKSSSKSDINISSNSSSRNVISSNSSGRNSDR
jgi:hypothetical protein